MAEGDYVKKAAMAGMMLLEYRDSLRACHNGTSGANTALKHNKSTPKEDQFKPWLAAHGIAERTAYRWIEVAERVARLQLQLPAAADFRPAIDVEGVVISLSQALTTPDAELPQKALQFKQGFFDFLQDKTLAEAARAAVDGESPGSRITRAGAGKAHGGSRGEDRKAWPTFIAKKLSDASSHLEHWPQFTAGQREITQDALRNAFEKWPTGFLEYAQKAIKAELAKR